MKHYSGIQGRTWVAAIGSAIEQSGGTVVRAPDPSIAPFEISIALPGRGRAELVCYAFPARKHKRRGRSADEHHFQVRYGRSSSRPHKIYVDETRTRVTLFFGIHEERNLFIAVDPEMHNPTRFSSSRYSSIEFAEADLEIAVQRGWHGWERERGVEGRCKVHPSENLCTEVVLAFRPEHFLTYVQLEGSATGLDAGERLLLIDQLGEVLRKDGSPIPAPRALRLS